MSADTSSRKLNLGVLFGELAEAIKQTAPEDLLAEAKASGQDTIRIAADVKNTLFESVRSFEQRRLHTARSGYRATSKGRHRRSFVLPATPAERLRMLVEAASRDQRVAQITARYRDLEELPDEDVKSALEDLIELGAFDDFLGQLNDKNK